MSLPFPEKRVIANSTDAIDSFLKEFRKAVLEPNFSCEKKRGLVEYVVFEALNNAWEHGNKKERKERTITICCENRRKSLMVSVEDQGEGF
ncbi:MAG: ATP-binding protein [Nitrospinota bacterium]